MSCFVKSSFDQLGGEESNMKNIACAVLAGSLSSAIANPTDVLKVSSISEQISVIRIMLTCLLFKLSVVQSVFSTIDCC